MSVLGRGDGSFLAGNLGFLLHVFDGRYQLAFFHVVTLFDVEVGDAPHRRRAQVDHGLGLDLAGAADNRGKVLTVDLGSKNLGVARLLLDDEYGNENDSHNDSRDDQKYLFHARFRTPGSSEIILRNRFTSGSTQAAKFTKVMNCLTVHRASARSPIPCPDSSVQTGPGISSLNFRGDCGYSYVTWNQPVSSQNRHDPGP